MSEKYHNELRYDHPQPSTRRNRLAIAALLMVTALWYFLGPSNSPSHGTAQEAQLEAPRKPSGLVPMEVHMMSKCPDSKVTLDPRPWLSSSG